MELTYRIVLVHPIRVSEFRVNAIKELSNGVKIVVCEAKKPAEIYTVPDNTGQWYG